MSHTNRVLLGLIPCRNPIELSRPVPLIDFRQRIPIGNVHNLREEGSYQMYCDFRHLIVSFSINTMILFILTFLTSLSLKVKISSVLSLSQSSAIQEEINHIQK